MSPGGVPRLLDDNQAVHQTNWPLFLGECFSHHQMSRVCNYKADSLSLSTKSADSDLTSWDGYIGIQLSLNRPEINFRQR